MFETILAPLDGSILAEQAIPYITEIAANFNSEITLIGVCEEDEYNPCRIMFNKQIEQLQNILNTSPDKYKKAMISGHPSHEILEYAKKYQVGLIVFTSHGRSGLTPWSLGGTAQKIIHSGLNIPLLMIRSSESRTSKPVFDSIILPLDKSRNSETVIPYVVELARRFHVKVILLHVIEEGKFIHTVGGLDYVRFEDIEISSEKTEIEHFLNEMTLYFSDTNVEIVREIRYGEAAREILKVASENKRSLIAMSSHGHSAISAWAFGSVTYKIVQASENPILLIKSKLD
jgi:nucleotide-binding universal stress UspA family protein